MIPGGPLYGLCIGNGHTGKNDPKKIRKNSIKMYLSFCMNEVFRGAFGSKIGPYGSKKYAGCDYEVRF